MKSAQSVNLVDRLFSDDPHSNCFVAGTHMLLAEEGLVAAEESKWSRWFAKPQQLFVAGILVLGAFTGSAAFGSRDYFGKFSSAARLINGMEQLIHREHR